MEKLAYLKITESLSPKKASDALALARSAGCDKVIVLHEEGADFTKARYKEKLLSVFRAAFRHKVKIYLSDDSYPYSGTGFGQLSGVKDIRQRELVKIDKTEKKEDEIVLEENGDKCIVARECGYNKAYPHGYYPDLTNPLSADFIADFVYTPILREYTKFAGFELAGFASVKPMWASACDGVLYSEEALKIFETEYKTKASLFSLADKGDEYEKYTQCLNKAMERNYLMPLRMYCKSKSVDFIVCGGEKSVQAAFCHKEGILYLADSLGDEGGYLMSPKRGEDVVKAYIQGMGIAPEIDHGLSEKLKLMDFLKAHEALPQVSVEAFDGNVGDGIIIINPTEKTISLSFLLKGEYIVEDWEKDELYDFEHNAAYTFCPHSFLCIRRKEEGVFTDLLPVRVGGVLCTWRCEETLIDFEKNENVCHFYLPDMPLFGRLVEFTGDMDALFVQLGSMSHMFITKPFVLPLFDFLRYAGGVAQSFGGTVEKIVIK